ncbi:hypothetical protein SSEA_SKINNY_151 [Mycobacterium phage Skinny]|uniref:Uncharacterized protein n=2 Tax=Bongovirus bongo TaxID=1983750 RepID=A0A514DJA9_9CAUD|nr:HNH endonuclease [Mycobacterium phage PegLeg]QDH93700.1 hypothetical protein SEA_LILHOMIEP_144 [Mycobacterium phage LilhomieP]QUU29328.1 hypothetical protein [Mycobacterium phage SirSheldon]UXE05319.1 hypothetical protein SSEA_SKINNY_151 [Mycobacterium phage Skinny]WNN95702.1 hypothetical protein SEA_GLASKE16_147 [Mycobacterium phage Glaske16]WNN96270.1 hypothetical protein SEA_DULCITA_145 [Mycobacterium phage Dulcita]WNO28214.1 hypothetical protein SEA_DIMINIMUS_145 [Mycobacterium phage D
MDPDEALKLIREMVEAHLGGGQVPLGELVVVVDGLDGWLSAGGFLPAAWAVNR